jgi:hypothetical protein
MREVHERTTDQTSWKTKTMLPVIFINREGDPETAGVPTSMDSAVVGMPESAASNRLRRALYETGQLVVTPKDGLSRICFAGVGDPERLLVEAVPRDVPVPAPDHDFPGCLCSLAQADMVLQRIYYGADSDHLAKMLDKLASRRRWECEENTDDEQKAA